MEKFKLELDVKNIEKIYKLPTVLNKVVSSWEKVTRQQKKIDEDSQKLINALRKQGASAERIWFIQKRASWAKFFTAARNPMSLISKGLLSIGSLIGAGAIAFLKWLAPLIAITGIIGGLIAIFRRLFAFNIGGLATQFYKIGAAIKLAWYKAMNDIVKLFKELDPIIRPMITFIGEKIVGIIRGFSAWFSSLTKNEKVIKGLKDYFTGIVSIFKVWWSLVKQFFTGFSQGFKGIFGDTQKGTSGFLEFMNVLIKIALVFAKIEEKLHIMQAIGAILGATFGVIAAIVKIIATVIEDMVESFKSVASIISGFSEGGVTGGVKAIAAESMKQRDRAINRINNNNVNIHSSGPITPDSAPRIGDIMSSQLRDAFERG